MTKSFNYGLYISRPQKGRILKGLTGHQRLIIRALLGYAASFKEEPNNRQNRPTFKSFETSYQDMVLSTTSKISEPLTESRLINITKLIILSFYYCFIALLKFVIFSLFKAFIKKYFYYNPKLL